MFYICFMGKIQNMKQVRIELICQKIKQGASIENIINYVMMSFIYVDILLSD
jgi:hypothetical protein